MNGHTVIPYHRRAHYRLKGWIPSVPVSVIERRKPNCTLFGMKCRYSAGPRPTPEFQGHSSLHLCLFSKQACPLGLQHQGQCSGSPILALCYSPPTRRHQGTQEEEARRPESKGQASEGGRARGPFRPTRDHLPRVHVCSQLNSWGTNL